MPSQTADTTYDVLALRYGVWHSTKREIYHSFHVYGEADAPVQIDYYLWVVRNGQRTIVVDTGFRPEVATRRGRTLVTPVPEALRLAGVDPLTVSHVVLTHFHYDHIGNVGLFPQAQLIAGATEYAFWTGPVADQPLFASAVEREEVDLVRKAHAEGRLTLVPEQDPGLPGIRFRELTGHTPGQIIVEVDAASGRRIILASDASHTYEEFEQERPFHIASSLPDMCVSLNWLHQQSRSAEIVPGHDPAVMARFPAADADTIGIVARIS
ncbi:N-acyl homoserine lactonase family protein [Nocardia callitridis]|uniref:N-acyl homoserine lactonase family protein n=1 Tax=Nocardia callitridis TaxID=648753 RepID=A0ABP9KTT0_9NOCA